MSILPNHKAFFLSCLIVSFLVYFWQKFIWDRIFSNFCHTLNRCLWLNCLISNRRGNLNANFSHGWLHNFAEFFEVQALGNLWLFRFSFRKRILAKNINFIVSRHQKGMMTIVKHRNDLLGTFHWRYRYPDLKPGSLKFRLTLLPFCQF